MGISIFYYILSAFLLTIGLISCNNEDDSIVTDNNCNYISFSAPEIKLSGNDTRAIVEGTTFPNNESFGVLGYCLANVAGTTNLDTNTGTTAWNNKKGLCTPHLFHKIEVKKTDAGCTYTAVKNTTTKQDVTNGLVAWYPANDYRYTFLAYYPYSGWTVPAINTLGEPTISYTVSDISNNPDLMVAANVDAMRGDGSVKFNFKHQMTGITLRVNNYDDGNALTVNSLDFTGTFHKTLNIKPDLSPSVSGTYTDTHNYGSFTVNKDTSKDLATLLFLTNGVSNIGSNVKITINYKSLITGNNTYKELPLATYLPSFNPQPGVIYTLQLTFIGNALTLEVIDANSGQWEGGDDVDSDITFE